MPRYLARTSWHTAFARAPTIHSAATRAAASGSKILGGKFTEVSLERLMRFLTALGYRTEIKIGAGNANRVGDVTIKDTSRTAA